MIKGKKKQKILSKARKIKKNKLILSYTANNFHTMFINILICLVLVHMFSNSLLSCG